MLRLLRPGGVGMLVQRSSPDSGKAGRAVQRPMVRQGGDLDDINRQLDRSDDVDSAELSRSSSLCFLGRLGERLRGVRLLGAFRRADHCCYAKGGSLGALNHCRQRLC